MVIQHEALANAQYLCPGLYVLVGERSQIVFIHIGISKDAKRGVAGRDGPRYFACARWRNSKSPAHKLGGGIRAKLPKTKSGNHNGEQTVECVKR